jgi:hypothetical protein
MVAKGQKPFFPKSIDEEIARSEINLEQRAVFTVSTFPKKWRKVVFREENEAGEVIEREVIVGKTKSGNAVGVLTTFHFKLYLVLLQLWEEAGRPVNNPVHFSGLEILRRLGYDKFGGNNYETIKQQLYDLAQVPIEFNTSFFVAIEKGYKTLEPFHILGFLRIFERKYTTKKNNESRTFGYGEFQFHRHILDVIRNKGYAL